MPATTPRAYQIGDIDWKQSVRFVATTSAPLNQRTYFGQPLSNGDRVLLTAQGGSITIPSAQNGIYQWSNTAGSLVRSIDTDTLGEMSPGLTVTVTEGQYTADTVWILNSQVDPVIPGTSLITFTQSGATASGGLGAIQFSTGSDAGSKLSSNAALTYSEVGLGNLTVNSPITTNSSVTASLFVGNAAGLTNIPAANLGGTFTGNVVITNTFLPNVTSTIDLGSEQRKFRRLYVEDTATFGAGPQSAGGQFTIQSAAGGEVNFVNQNTLAPASVVAGDVSGRDGDFTNVTASADINGARVIAGLFTGTNLTVTGGLVGATVTANSSVTTQSLSATNANITNLNFANGVPRVYVESIQAGTGLQTNTGSPITTTGTLSLTNTGVTAGTYGSATQVGRLTVDAQGRVSTVTNVTVTPAFSSITNTPTTLSGYGITDAINVVQKGNALGVATLDITGKIPAEQLPPVAISNTFVVANYTDLANLTTALTGDIGIVTANNSSYILQSEPYSTLTNWVQLLFPVAVSSVNGKTGAVVLNPGDIGAAANTVTITAGTGLQGGGNLTTNRTIALANTAITPGTYGDVGNIPQITFDQQGRATSVTNIPNDPSSGLIYAIALG